MEADKAARARGFLVLASGLVSTPFLRLKGVVCWGFIGVADEGSLFREWDMAGDRIAALRRQLLH